MSKKNKLLDRFLSVPIDFTWNELVKLLAFYGYKEINAVKTSDSRRRFVNGHNFILLHKPHLSSIGKKYAIRQIIETLKQNGKIGND